MTKHINHQTVSWDKIISIGLIVVSAGLLRLMPHPPNFAPIGALALFSGAHMSKRAAIIVSLSAMLVSDIFLGFHSTMAFVYGSFIAIIFIGHFIRKNKPASIFGASFAASVLFFIVTNFGVWAVGSIYPKTLNGLLNAYVLAIPFFRNTFVSDLVYTFSFFYGYIIIAHVLNRHTFVRIKNTFKS